MKNLLVFALVALLATACIGAISGCNPSTSAEADVQQPATVVTNQTQSAQPHTSGGGMAAMQKAAEAKKYLFAPNATCTIHGNAESPARVHPTPTSCSSEKGLASMKMNRGGLLWARPGNSWMNC